jgi:small subunit ribosomal protein S3
MSRTLEVKLGSLPLSTFQARVEYGFAEAFTAYGAIGVKAWVYKGEYDAVQEEENQSNAAGARARARGRR